MTDTTKQIAHPEFHVWAEANGYAMALDNKGNYLWHPTKCALESWLAARAAPVSPAQPTDANNLREAAIKWAQVHYRNVDEFTENDLQIVIDTWKEAHRAGDRHMRDRVTAALGLDAGVPFAWSYLLGLIESAVEACEKIEDAAPAKPQPDLHSAGTIDTPEFRRLLSRHVQGRMDCNEALKNSDSALITHIMDWHSARMAAALENQADLIARLRRQVDAAAEKLADRETALAAAREQALEGLTDERISEIYEQATSYPLADDDWHGAIAFARAILATITEAQAKGTTQAERQPQPARLTVEQIAIMRKGLRDWEVPENRYAAQRLLDAIQQDQQANNN